MTELSKKSPPSVPPTAATEASKILADMKTAWAPLKGEPSRLYDYAFEFFILGPGRSISKLLAAGQKTSQEPTKYLPGRPRLKELSAKWKWLKRAAAYDVWLQASNVEAMEVCLRKDAEKWTPRELELREKVFSQGQQFIEQADTMLKAPLFEQQRIVEVYEDGREKVIQQFKPSKWAKRDALRYAMVGQAMAGAAIRNENSRATEVLELDDWTKLVPYRGPGT